MKNVLAILTLLVFPMITFAGPGESAKENFKGYWKFDMGAMEKVIDDQVSKMPEEQRAMAKQMRSAMMVFFKTAVIHNTDEKTTAYFGGKVEENKLNIVKEEGNQLTIKDEKKGNEVTFTVEKDKCSFSEQGMTMSLVKIDEAEAKKMIEEGKKAAEEQKKQMAPNDAPAEEAPAE